MSRPNRITPGGLPFHVLNRAVGRRTIFPSAADYECFIETVAETLRTRRMRICGYCVMPNHWHMVLWPEQDGDLSARFGGWQLFLLDGWREIGSTRLRQSTKISGYGVQHDETPA